MRSRNRPCNKICSCTFPPPSDVISHSLPLSRVSQKERSHYTSRDTNATQDGNSHETLAGNLVIDQLAQVGRLQIGGLLVEKQVVVPAGFAVVAQLVVS